MSEDDALSRFLWRLWRRSNNVPFARSLLTLVVCWLGNNSYHVQGRRNIVDFSGAALMKVDVDIVGDGNTVLIGEGSQLTNIKIRIRGSGHRLEIGSGCSIKGGSLWFEDTNGQILVGERTRIEEAHLAVTELGSAIHIGRECLFAYDIEVRTGDSHSIVDLATGERLNPAQSVSIGNHVWVAAHVRILKGVSIGDHAVIGTGSIVTASVPKNSLAVGAPARVMRDGITWKKEKL